MLLNSQAFLLRSGSKIRVGSIVVFIANEYIYQYEVEMLFRNNNWQCIFVSKLYEEQFRFFLIVQKYIDKSKKNFKVTKLTKRAREKYGHEIILNSSKTIKV